MYYIKKLFLLIVLGVLIQKPLFAEVPHFLDFKYILNQSDAGKKAQNFYKVSYKKVLKIYK